MIKEMGRGNHEFYLEETEFYKSGKDSTHIL